MRTQSLESLVTTKSSRKCPSWMDGISFSKDCAGNLLPVNSEPDLCVLSCVQGDQARPRVVKRGTEEFENLDEGKKKIIKNQ